MAAVQEVSVMVEEGPSEAIKVTLKEKGSRRLSW